MMYRILSARVGRSGAGGVLAWRAVAPRRSLGPCPALLCSAPDYSAERAFSTPVTAARPSPPPPPAATRALDAEALRALDVAGVVALVESLGVDADDAKQLGAQKVDGAALLEMTEDKLRSCGVPLGPACAIMRAVAEAQAVTLHVFPPLKKGARNNPVKVTLTPAEFRVKYVLSQAPLQLVSTDGAVLREIMSLEQAVEATREGSGSVRLHASRSFGDELE
jgi:hypothetical protein